MDVTNATWQLVGAGSDASLVVQNVGVSRIAFVFATAQPAVNAINLDSSGHGVLKPGMDPMTVKDLNTYSKNMYVRALGSVTGKLYVEAN
jgi:hypothetical protein